MVEIKKGRLARMAIFWNAPDFKGRTVTAMTSQQRGPHNYMPAVPAYLVPV